MRSEQDTQERSISVLNAIKWKLMRGWGMVFRTIFIALVAIVSYGYFDPQDISDIPFSELTLRDIFNNLFAVLIVIGCLYWFANFPKTEYLVGADDDSYVNWGRAGLVFFFIVGGVLYWLIYK